MRFVASAVLAAAALALLGLTASVLAGLTSTYGPDAVLNPALAALVLAPAGLALLCLVGARDPVGPPRPRTPVLAAGVLLVFCATGAAAVAYGAGEHVPGEESTCSPEDLDVLASFDAPGARSLPLEDGAGGCEVTVWGVPDLAEAEAEAVEAVEDDGWRRTAREGDAQVFVREGEVVRLSATSNGTATDVRLAVP